MEFYRYIHFYANRIFAQLHHLYVLLVAVDNPVVVASQSLRVSDFFGLLQNDFRKLNAQTQLLRQYFFAVEKEELRLL